MEFDKIAVICLLTACRIISVLTFRKYVLLPFSGRVSLFQLVAKVTDGGRFFFFRYVRSLQIFGTFRATGKTVPRSEI